MSASIIEIDGNVVLGSNNADTINKDYRYENITTNCNIYIMQYFTVVCTVHNGGFTKRTGNHK